MSFATELKTAYTALVGGTPTVYVGFGPKTRPATYHQLVPTGGLSLRWPRVDVARTTWQVNVVTKDDQAATAYEAALAAYTALLEKTNWKLTSYTILHVLCLQEPVLFGLENGQVSATFNVILTARKG